MSAAEAWADATAALALFAVDPAGLGGIAVRACAGPVRDHWLALLRDALPQGTPLRRMPLRIGDDRLLGGLDLAATLQAGRPISQKGLLAEADGGVVLLAMAERIDPGAAARLCGAMDQGMVVVQRDGISMLAPSLFGLVALDEGETLDERVPASLLDRMAFHIDLNEVTVRDIRNQPVEAADVHRMPPSVDDPPPLELDEIAVTETLCSTAMALGIWSVRAPLLALRVARAAAERDGRTRVTLPDLTLAARLVFASRATHLDPAEEAQPPPDGNPPPASRETTGDDAAQAERPIDDVVLQAVRAVLPPDLLSRLACTANAPGRSRTPGRAGQFQAAMRHGRPIGIRPGEATAGARLNVLETLKVALPWQSLRRRSDGDRAPRIEVRRDDFRIIRFRQHTQTTTVFAVDASGSAALHRLAEAKGAVELLLADCYVRRDLVALIAFRGRGAELLLPPTGSLLRAKRCLAGLPGGGGTPLAGGINAAAALADAERRKGRTPVIALLTDGRANITRGGNGGRQQGEAEALEAGRMLRAAGLAALLVDTSPRPNPFARRLAGEMGACYTPLPYADATALSKAVRCAAVP